MKTMFLRQVCLLLIASVGIISCASVKESTQPALPSKDPWNGRYRHFSGRFDLVLRHFAPEYVDAEIVGVPIIQGQGPQSYFSCVIKKGDKAVFQAPSEPDCKVELQLVERGVVLSDFCHGTGEDIGLYRPFTE